MRGLAPVPAVLDVLDRRLLARSERPIAVAISGGGDSAALLLAAQAWANWRGRRLLALAVDHRLQPQSGAWIAACANLAQRAGAEFQALAWTGEKPATGLPAAARQARHRLLAEAARAAGARVLLLGHTADDVLEARAMRRAGSTTPEPREWAPSPAWPQGRGLFLLRPLLALRRAALRDRLVEAGVDWIEDPANADLRYARPRARAALADDETAPPAEPETPLTLARDLATLPGGGFRMARPAFRAAPELERERLLALASVCAGGASRPPRRDAVARLALSVSGSGRLDATLAGARIVAEDDSLSLVRNPGEAARGGLAPLRLSAHSTGVWDGRLEVTAGPQPVEVRALAGVAAHLPQEQRRALARIPAIARGALPVVVGPDGVLSCPLLGEGLARAVPLTAQRLEAAAGLVEREPG